MYLPSSTPVVTNWLFNSVTNRFYNVNTTIDFTVPDVDWVAGETYILCVNAYLDFGASSIPSPFLVAFTSTAIKILKDAAIKFDHVYKNTCHLAYRAFVQLDDPKGFLTINWGDQLGGANDQLYGPEILSEFVVGIEQVTVRGIADRALHDSHWIYASGQ